MAERIRPNNIYIMFSGVNGHTYSVVKLTHISIDVPPSFGSNR